MTRSLTRVAAACVALIGALLPIPTSAAPVNVRLDTSTRFGQPATLSFELTSNNKAQMFDLGGDATIYNFQHNGTFGLPSSQGGMITGDLVLGLNPAYYSDLRAWSVDSSYFGYTQLGVNFTALGNQVTFSADLSAYSPGEASLLEQLSFYVLKPDGTPAIHTADPFGTHALFALEAVDPFGTQLQVFSPAVFVPPDSVVLSFPVLDVPVARLLDRIRLRMLGENPSFGPVRMQLELPGNSGRTRIDLYDATGRRVRTVADGPFAPGKTELVWDGTDQRGERVRAGVYWLVVKCAGQTLSQRLVRLR